MARKIKLVLQEIGNFELSLVRITTESIYGKRFTEKRSLNGETLSQISVSLDDFHFLTPKSVNLIYMDDDLLYTSEVVPTDKEGNKLTIIEDMFKSEILLDKVITIDEFFTYNISKTYILESDSDFNQLIEYCNNLLSQNKLLVFTYAYRKTAYPETAILVPQGSNLFVEVGNSFQPLWCKLNVNLPISSEEEEEEEEIDFSQF